MYWFLIVGILHANEKSSNDLLKKGRESFSLLLIICRTYIWITNAMNTVTRRFFIWAFNLKNSALLWFYWYSKANKDIFSESIYSKTR